MTARAGLVLQHSENGPPGRLGRWLDARGIAYDLHRSWESDPDLDPTDYGFVASLGSVHSVTDADPAWIPVEIGFLRRAAAANVPVLGLCWGGQALAAALGGRVGPSPFPEKGWLTIDSADPAIPTGPWLHYHSEVFTVPPGAVELARSPAGPAAFRAGAGGTALALQFHPEAGAETAARWAARDPEQTDASRAQLAEQGARWDAGAAQLAFELFDRWWAGASRAG